MYRSGGTAHHHRLLWMSDKNVLEATQGQTVQEGRQGSRRHEECPDAYQCHEGKGLRWFPLPSVPMRAHVHVTTYA